MTSVVKAVGSVVKPNRRLGARIFFGGIPAESRESVQEMRNEQPVLENVDSLLLTVSATSRARVHLDSNDIVTLPSLGWFASHELDVPWRKVVSMWKTYRRNSCSHTRAAYRARQWQRYFVDLWPETDDTARFIHNVLSLYGDKLRSGEILSFRHGDRQMSMLNLDTSSQTDGTAENLVRFVRQEKPRRHFSVRPWDHLEADVWLPKKQEVRALAACFEHNLRYMSVTEVA